MPTLLATALCCATDPDRAPLTTTPEAMHSEQRVRLLYPYLWNTHAHPPCVIWTRRCGHAVDCTAIASLMATGWAAGVSALQAAGLPSSHACLVERAWPSRYARPPIRRQRYKAALPGVFASAGRSGRFIKRNSFKTTTHLPTICLRFWPRPSAAPRTPIEHH